MQSGARRGCGQLIRAQTHKVRPSSTCAGESLRKNAQNERAWFLPHRVCVCVLWGGVGGGGGGGGLTILAALWRVLFRVLGPSQITLVSAAQIVHADMWAVCTGG
jgi:hypothetical protein